MIRGHATATMTMDLYGHLFSDAPWVAMERIPMFPDFGPNTGDSSGERPLGEGC